MMSVEETEDSDWLSEKEDFERPAKLDLIVGFLRLLCFLSVCTSVFAVFVSVLFLIQQTKSIDTEIWDVFVFMDGDRFNYLKIERDTERVLFKERHDFVGPLHSRHHSAGLPGLQRHICHNRQHCNNNIQVKNNLSNE